MTAGDYPEVSVKYGENVVTKQRQDTDKKKNIPRFDRDVFVWNLIIILFFFFFFLTILTQNTDTQTDKKEKEERDQKKMDTY